MADARMGCAPRCMYITITAVSFTHCEREARYIDAEGRLCCALCPLIHGIDSIRLSDVPALLAKVRDFVDAVPRVASKCPSVLDATADEVAFANDLREIIGKGTGR